DDFPMLGLSDAELDRVSAGTLVIGDNDTGAITITSAIDLPASTHVEIISSQAITNNASLDTSGGTLRLETTNSVVPEAAGLDYAASSLLLEDGARLSIAINGPAVDTGYSQLRVAGEVHLGIPLQLAGTYTP